MIGLSHGLGYFSIRRNKRKNFPTISSKKSGRRVSPEQVSHKDIRRTGVWDWGLQVLV
jgi:hypothetical protein